MYKSLWLVSGKSQPHGILSCDDLFEINIIPKGESKKGLFLEFPQTHRLVLLRRNVQAPGTTEQRSLRGPSWDPEAGGQAGGQQAPGAPPGNQGPRGWRSDPCC